MDGYESGMGVIRSKSNSPAILLLMKLRGPRRRFQNRFRGVPFPVPTTATKVTRKPTVSSAVRRARLFLAALAFVPLATRAQDFAPSVIADSRFNLTITNGAAPFVSTGGYQLFTAPAGTNYAVLGQVGPAFSAGSFTYLKTGAASALLAFPDSQARPGLSLSLAFSSSSAGTFSLTAATGAQYGAFTTTNYSSPSPPELFLPDVIQGRFQSWLSGQRGFVYNIQGSSDLALWSSVTNIPLAGSTALLVSSAAPQCQFFRAKTQSAAFAPDSLTNKTLNLAITGGAASETGAGLAQWMADTNGNGCQIFGGPGVTDSSGSYYYAKTGPNSGQLSYLDSLAGAVNEQLVFTAPASGYFYATNSAGFETGSFDLADGASLFLGRVGFTPDSARASSFYFPANGQPAALSATNAQGWVWTLSFPADALPLAQQITMTPFAAIDASASVLPISAGVQLEPDGLQFCDAVTLTVAPPQALGLQAALVLANDDGSDLHFVETTNQAASYATTLLHFTSAGITDPSGSAWDDYARTNLLPKTQAAYAQAKSDIQGMLTSTNVPPPPPDYAWTCSPTNTAAGAQVAQYVASVFAPQSEAIIRLLSAASELKQLDALLNTNVDPGSEPKALARSVIETNEIPQVTQLFNRYYRIPDPNNATNNVEDPVKFMGVYELAMNVNSQDKLYGGHGNTNWPGSLKTWAKGMRTAFLTLYKTQHLYQMEEISEQVESFMENILNTGPDQNYDSSLLKASAFKLTVDITFTVSGGEADDLVEAEGDTTNVSSSVGSTPLQGSGVIHYLSGSSSGDGETVTLVPGQTFTLQPQISFDACDTAQTVSIILDRFGADTENWTDGQYQFGFSGLLQSGCSTVFADHQTSGGYTFTVPLQNGNPAAASQTVEEERSTPDGLYDAKVTFTLLHTPK